MNKIDPKKLLSPSKDSAIQKKLDSSVLVPFKSVEISSKVISIPKLIDKPEKGEDRLESVVIEIKTSVLNIEKVLKTNTNLLKKQTRITRKTDQDQKRKEKEEGLEKKTKRDKFPNLKKPDLPRTGIIDYIKNFLSWVIIGRAFVLFGKYLPKLIEFLKNLKPLYDLFKVIGGALFNGLVTFVEWTDKAQKKVREIAGSLGGEPFQKAFDNFSGALTTFANLALIAGMATMGGSDLGLGDALDGDRRGGRRGGRSSRRGGYKNSYGGGKRGIDGDFKRGRFGGYVRGFGVDSKVGGGVQGQNLWQQRAKGGELTDAGLKKAKNDIVKRYAKRYGKGNAINRFGKETFKSLGGKYSRSGATNLARKGAVSLLGKGGTKTVLKIARPLVKRLPIIGGLVDFGLSVALGESLGRAAFKAIGAGVLGAIGAGFGGPLGAIIGGFAGDWAGAKLYDIFFQNKKTVDKDKPQKKNKGGTIKPKKGKVINTKVKAKAKSRISSKRLKKLSIKKISPGKNLGGKQEAERLYPNPDSQSSAPSGGFSWFNFLFGGGKPNEGEEKKKRRERRRLRNKNKIPNATKALLGVADRLEKSANWISYLMRAGIEVALGQMPDVKSLASIVAGVFDNISNSGANFVTKELIGFAGGGEIANSNLSSTRYFQEILPLQRSIEKDLRTTLQDSLNVVKTESKKRGPTGRDEMLEENRERPPRSPDDGNAQVAGGAVAPSELYKEIGANLEQWNIFRNSIALIESGGRYSAMGGSGKHYDGRYQMGEAAKKDGSRVAGVPYPGHGSDPNDSARVSFRNNPKLQETLFTGFTIANHRYLMRNEKYKTASVERKLQILGYAHNQGMGGAETWLTTGVVGSDGFGTKGTKYTDLIAKNFRAKKSGGNLELAKGAIDVPSDTGQKDNAPRRRAGAGWKPAKPGLFNAIQYITGDKSHPNFELDGHGLTTNYHDHIAFSTIDDKEKAKKALRAAGIQIGSEYRKGDPGYHGLNLAIDVPGFQWGGSGAIGQKEFAGSKKVRSVLGLQGGGQIDMNYKKINNVANSLNSYDDDESDVQLIIQPMIINTDQNRFAISTPPKASGGLVNFTGSQSHNLHR